MNAAWNIVNFRQGLVRRLQQEGYAITVAAPPDGHRDAIEALGCRFVPIAIDPHGRSPIADMRVFARYLALLARERPLAMLGFTAKPNIWGSLAARFLGIPVVNNVAGLGRVFGERGVTNHIVRRLYRVALRSSARTFFQNSEDRMLFVDSGLARAATSEVLPGSGVDLARFHSEDRARPAGAPFVFLLVGRLLRAKGVAELVAAGRSLRASGRNLQVRILGFTDDDDPAYVSHAELAAWHDDGAIEYLGAAADVRPHLAAADALVLPTYYPEGTPRALLEAAATGLPIITCDRPGCRDVVEPGISGWLVPPRDAVALAAAMRRLLDLSPAAYLEMGRASRRVAERRFDERFVTDRYVAALSRIAAGGEARG